MPSDRAELAIQSLYENPSTRSELSDAEAETLLQWGVSQIQRLAVSEMDDTAFEEATGQLRRLLRRMNFLAAQRGYLPAADQAQALQNIAEHAAAIGLTLPEFKQQAFLAQPQAQAQTEASIHANVYALIDLVADDSAQAEQATDLRAQADDTLDETVQLDDNLGDFAHPDEAPYDQT
jgi:hypothetical protein